jgi:Protein of unknown function (DUF3048) N-terminal domain
MTRRHRSRAVTVAIVALVATAACSSPKPQQIVGTQPQASASAAAPSPSPSPVSEPLEPLTGLPGTATGAAVVVPFDIAKGAPKPVGIADADIVSVEFSEQGTLRLVGIFQSKSPSKVGPVGAARPSDLKVVDTESAIIAQSGATIGTVETAKAFHVTIRSPGRSAPGFSSSGRSVYVNPTAVRGTDKTAPPAMFEYSTGRPLSRVAVSTVHRVVIAAPGHTPLTWTLDATTKLWHTTIAGIVMTTPNLVILTTPYTTKYVSSEGRNLSFAAPLGSGKATVVASDGAIAASWYKKGFDGFLNMLGPDQDTPQLTAGTTWIMLAPTGSKVTTS